jgi:hypothetical protein
MANLQVDQPSSYEDGDFEPDHMAVIYKAIDIDLSTIDDEENSYSSQLLRELRVLEKRAQAGPASSNPDCPTSQKVMPLTWVTDWNWYQSNAVGHSNTDAGRTSVLTSATNSMTGIVLI